MGMKYIAHIFTTRMLVLWGVVTLVFFLSGGHLAWLGLYALGG